FSPRSKPRLGARGQSTQLSDPSATLELLRTGELTLQGRLLTASNATFCGEVRSATAGPLTCVYKPVRGERPLDDFPDATLGRREVASYLVSERLGWE